MTAILGISALYHDSAAALVVDGRVVAAAQEERFSRHKHDARFPARAIEYCLAEGGLSPEQLDYVVFYDKPLVKLERLLETYLAFAPRGLASFSRAMPGWLKEKLFTRRVIRRGLGRGARAKAIFLDHHESHAASAFFPSPFEDAAILTLDGVGEWSTTTLGVGDGNRIVLTDHLRFPHSLGLLYSAFTSYCGFNANGGEYKLMGLAPFGTPVYEDLIRRHLVDLLPDGSLWLDQKYFAYCHGLAMTSDAFHRLLGGPPRAASATIEQRHMDLAASIQAVLEDAVLRMAAHLHSKTGRKNLVLAGGVALNAVANGRLAREGPFESTWIQPAAGDAGGALGAALFVWHQLLDRPRRPRGDAQRGSFLGPGWSSPEVGAFLEREGAPHRLVADERALLESVTDDLVQGKVVGWFQGRMEYGPRALGARSILGDPRSPAMQSVVNTRIKFRESFRPFAPAVLRQHAHEWFTIEPDQESPYMLVVAPLLERHRLALTADDDAIRRTDADLRRRLAVQRSTVPAVTHVDFSARVQTVDAARHGRFHRLLETFFARTGCPMVVNTSFNVRGEPIVCSPADAFRCFRATDMDTLVLEDFVLRREEFPPIDARDRERYRARGASEDAGVRPPREPDAPPSPRMLREFAVLWIVCFGAIATWRLEVRGQPTVAVVLAVLALAVGGAGLAKPALVRPIFVGWTRVTRPVGDLVSTLVVALVFATVFVPVGLLFRILGRDALALRRRSASTYWQAKETPSDPRTYLRQS